jgi:hypothetical protein
MTTVPADIVLWPPKPLTSILGVILRLAHPTN